MATVTSLTATRIQELLAGYEAIGLTQDEINALVIQLNTNVLEQGASLEDFNESVRPQLEAAAAANATALSDLNDNILPNLQADLDQAASELETINTITIPDLQTDVANTVLNVAERPNVYVQDDPPENPDANDRDLVVGDTWFDTNNDNVQHIWDGVAWTTLSIDVSNLTVEVKNFISGKHQIY